jgi:hypothetical protein
MKLSICIVCGDELIKEEQDNMSNTCARCQIKIDRCPAGFYWDGERGCYVDQQKN